MRNALRPTITVPNKRIGVMFSGKRSQEAANMTT
jgi:hypothetical protein